MIFQLWVLVLVEQGYDISAVGIGVSGIGS